MKLIKVEYLNCYLLFEPNSALYAFTIASKLKFKFPSLGAKLSKMLNFHLLVKIVI